MPDDLLSFLVGTVSWSKADADVWTHDKFVETNGGNQDASGGEQGDADRQIAFEQGGIEAPQEGGLSTVPTDHDAAQRDNVQEEEPSRPGEEENGSLLDELV